MTASGIDQSVHSVICHQAQIRPEAPAILAPGRKTLNYSRLWELILQVRNQLALGGVALEDRVAVVLPNSPEMATTFLAVSSGAGCCPLNPNYTLREFEDHLADLQARAIILTPGFAPSARAAAMKFGLKIFEMTPGPEAGWFSLTQSVEKSGATALSVLSLTDSNSVALWLHTSGSTSRPKLVPIRHRSICISSENTATALGLTDQDRCLNMLPLFHVHGLVSGLLLPLIAGGSVVFTSGFDPLQFTEWLRVFQPTWYSASPGMHIAILEQLQGNLRSSLRFIRTGSATISSSIIDALESALGVPMIEAYGMSEVPHISGNPLRYPKKGSVGKSAGPEVAIMDETGLFLACGEIGEIVVRGPTVMSHYENNPEANQTAFFNGWLKTGDQGWLDDEGYIFLTGRLKEFINSSGQKISPYEVEQSLKEHPEVDECAAFAVPDRELGEVVGAAVVLVVDSNLNEIALRRFLSKRLTGFKMPQRIVTVPTLPKGPTGKLLRVGMAAHFGMTQDSMIRTRPGASLVTPRSPVEAELVRIWQNVLCVDQIGVEDNFFELGGHSLRATRVMAQVRQSFQVKLPLRSIFESPTLSGQAAMVEAAIAARRKGGPSFELGNGGPADDAKIVKRHPGRECPALSFAQQRLWFLDRFNETNTHFHLIAALRLRNGLKHEILEKALNAVVARHEILRTSFIEENGEPMQKIAPVVEVVLPVADFSQLEEKARAVAIAGVVKEEEERPFELNKGPMFRVRLIKLGERDHILLRTFHHIVSDGWSIGLFNRELAAFYNAYCKGGTPNLDELPVQYTDYALWQREQLKGELLNQQLEYWRKLLICSVLLDLPTDHPRPALQRFRGANHDFVLTRSIGEKLKEFNRKANATPFMTLLAAFQVLLARYGGKTTVEVGVPIANRQNVELENLIGLFANMLVLRTDFSGQPDFRELVFRVRTASLDAYEQQDLPFEKLVEALNPKRDMSRHPLFQVVFAMQNAPSQALELAGLEACPHPLPVVTTQFELELHLRPEGADWAASFHFNTGIFERATIERMAGHYQVLLESLLSEPDLPVLEAPLLTTSEHQQILTEWNQTQQDYPRDKCVHHLFEARVEISPNEIAAAMDGNSLTYRELNVRANQLAHRLRSLGVGPDDLVAVFVERSLEMVVALLGVLKAGGAYLPLDAGLPQKRLERIFADAPLKAVLTKRQFATMVQSCAAPALFLDEPLNETLQTNPESGVLATHLCYAIYTSGSTGNPKGVLVPHRGVVNLVTWHARTYGLGPGIRTTQLANLSFDAVAWELWPTLSAGGTVFIVDEQTLMRPETLVDWIAAHRISVCFLPTPLAEAALKEEWPAECRLRYLLTGGDQLSCRPGGNHRFQLINHYGPTEATVLVTAGIVTAAETGLSRRPSIGSPIPNSTVYILDEKLKPVPRGVAGEIWIGGDGVARGYLNEPDLTATRFVPDPFSQNPNGRLYKSGDLARYLNDGTIEFIGRCDHQMKLRGYRIELGEIEAALRAQPEIGEAVVALRAESADEKQLVAYLVSRTDKKPDASDLRSRLGELLPNFMLPTSFVWLEQLPLTPNGKVNRKALPAAHSNRVVDNHPVSLLELELIRLWEQVFGRKDIGRHDDFFALGGHSLLAAKLVAKVEKFLGCQLPIAVLFQSPTVESLARRLAEEDRKTCRVSLVPLQPTGSRPPFFLVHGWGGNVFGFLEMARLFAPDQPVYGLQAVGLDGKSPRHTSLEEMASHYIQEIRSFHPNGPYFIGGYSMGGLIAFEMAQQLTRDGQQIGLLALLDTMPSSILPWTVYCRAMASYLPNRLMFHCRKWRQMPPKSRFDYFLGRLAALQHWMARNRSKTPAITSPSLQAGRLPPINGSNDYYADVARTYRVSPFSGDMDIFLSKSAPPHWVASWKRLVRGSVRFHPVPGAHFEILQQPHLSVLVQELQSALRRGQSGLQPCTPAKPAQIRIVQADEIHGGKWLLLKK